MQNKQRMINADMKDRLLKHLCTKIPVGDSCILDIYEAEKEWVDLDLKANEYRAILNTFYENGLVALRGGDVGSQADITIKEAAHDFLQKGGYTLQNEIFIKNLEKLHMECEKLAESASTPGWLKEIAKEMLTAGLQVLPNLVR